MEKGFFSTPELAELLGVFHTTVRRWIERDHIKGFRVGRNYKIPTAEVIRMLDQHGLPLPETLKRCATKSAKGDGKLFEEVHASGSILKKLLIVDEIDAPALIFRRETILGANQAFARMVGFSQMDLIGTRIKTLIGEFGSARMSASAQRSFENQENGPVECAIYLKDNNLVDMKTTIAVSPLGDLKDVFVVVVIGSEKVISRGEAPLFSEG